MKIKGKWIPRERLMKGIVRAELIGVYYLIMLHDGITDEKISSALKVKEGYIRDCFNELIDLDLAELIK